MTKILPQSKKHFDSCHKRWLNSVNRNINSKDYNEDWQQQQCGACDFFIPLTGAFINDWGACSNEKSKFDGKVRFEHDGCEYFKLSPRPWGAVFPSEKEIKKEK